MKRYLPVIVLVIAVGLFIGCGGEEEDGDNGELTGPGKFESFEKAIADTKALADCAVLKKDKGLATSAAETAETSWEDVKTNFPAEPPAKFEGDTEWADRVDTLIRLTGDVGEQAAAEDFEAAEASIREIQKQLLDLDDMNKISTAGDEVIRLLILTDQLIVAFEEDRDEDAKHVMTQIFEAQQNFFGAPIPDEARDRQDEFYDMKDKVYDSIEEMQEAPNREERIMKMNEMKTVMTEFWVEFG
ncbi:MAG: hypothetical protein JSW52_12055 [Candidatus Coatesbacteria bacterium]|nr:MAG: hypothetical protein JSW52_12055 [Candidatus Coatesbacteria bacterium]